MNPKTKTIASLIATLGICAALAACTTNGTVKAIVDTDTVPAYGTAESDRHGEDEGDWENVKRNPIDDIFALDTATSYLTAGLDAFSNAIDEQAAETETESEPVDDGTVHISIDKHAIGDYWAHEDGSSNEWQECYYVAHDWSYVGGQIANLSVGDVVDVDGMTVTIAGVTTFPELSYYTDVRDTVGWDTVVFQTCDGNGGVIIVYGYADVPVDAYTPEQQALDAERAGYAALEEERLSLDAEYMSLMDEVESLRQMPTNTPENVAAYEEASDAYLERLADYETRLADYQSRL